HQPITAFGCRVLNAVDSNIDNDHAVAHVLGYHKIGLTYGRDQNVSRTRNLREIPAARMNDRYGGICVFVFLHKQKGKRFADNHAASKDDDVRAADVDLAFDEQTLHAK